MLSASHRMAGVTAHPMAVAMVGLAVAGDAQALTQAVVRQRVKGMTAATAALPTTMGREVAVVLVP